MRHFNFQIAGALVFILFFSFTFYELPLFGQSISEKEIKNLYNQDELILSDAFEGLSVEEQNEFLLDHFKKEYANWQQKNCHLKIVDNFGHFFIEVLGFLGGYYFIAHFFLPKMVRTHLNGVNKESITEKIMIPGLVSALTTSYFTVIRAAFGPIFKETGHCLYGDMQHLYDNRLPQPPKLSTRQIDYIIAKRVMDPALTKKIEKKLAIECGHNFENPSCSALVEAALKVPQSSLLLKYDKFFLDERLAHYSNETKERIETFCMQHTGITLKSSNGEISRHNLVAYFEGPIGTGKTRAAFDISQALGVPLIEVSLFKLLAGDTPAQKTLADLILSSGEPYIKNIKNKVLLIDDIDMGLSNKDLYWNAKHLLLSLSHPHRRTIKDSLLGELDISEMIIIFSSQKHILDEALKSNVYTIHFAEFSLDKKWEIIKETIHKEYPSLFVDHSCPECLLSAKEEENLKKLVFEAKETDLKSLLSNVRIFLDWIVYHRLEKKEEDNAH